MYLNTFIEEKRLIKAKYMENKNSEEDAQKLILHIITLFPLYNAFFVIKPIGLIPFGVVLIFVYCLLKFSLENLFVCKNITNR